jgi:effector-binding domain-containing protein
MLIPIGQFSKMVRLSVKALRLYADRGLLLPAYTDSETSYRYYKASQAKRAEIIRILRSVDMPLNEILDVLDAGEPAEAGNILLVHRERMEDRLRMQERMLVYLETLIENKERIMPHEITVIPASPILVAGVRMHTALSTIKTDVGQGFSKIMQGIGEKRYVPAGPPMLVYHDVVDEESDGEVEVCIPVQTTFASGDDFQCHQLEADQVATTVHHGPYEELSSAYHSMLAWIGESAYELAGSPREIYLNDPRTVSPDQLQTKLEFPVVARVAKEAGE